jgi:hypothetical protein
MSVSDLFFRALGIDPGDRRQLTAAAKRSGIPVARLRYYNDANILPPLARTWRLYLTWRT